MDSSQRDLQDQTDQEQMLRAQAFKLEGDRKERVAQIEYQNPCFPEKICGGWVDESVRNEVLKQLEAEKKELEKKINPWEHPIGVVVPTTWLNYWQYKDALDDVEKRIENIDSSCASDRCGNWDFATEKMLFDNLDLLLCLR